jgi:hypothetical protein
MLTGKHLKIMDSTYPPYAILDASAPHGWRGFNVDLLDQLSWLLGFSFDIHDMGSPGSGETWDDVLWRSERNADLLASWWGVSPVRMERVLYLPGHLDSSAVLVARRLHSNSGGDWMHALFAWSAPFAWPVWVCVVLLVLASGLVDWLVEVRPHDRLEKQCTARARCMLGGRSDLDRIEAASDLVTAARAVPSSEGSFIIITPHRVCASALAQRDAFPAHRIAESVYEYTAGTLWGGFEQPLTRRSAIYQVVLAFVVVIINASCTLPTEQQPPIVGALRQRC